MINAAPLQCDKPTEVGITKWKKSFLTSSTHRLELLNILKFESISGNGTIVIVFTGALLHLMFICCTPIP